MQRITKSFLVALFLASLVMLVAIHLLAAGTAPVVGPPAYESVRQFEWAGLKRLELHNLSGDIRIRAEDTQAGHAKARVRIHTRRKGTLVDTYAETLLTSENGPDGLVRLVGEPSERPQDLEVQIQYEISVPNGCTLDVNNLNGNVTIDGKTGDIKVRCKNADIGVDGPEGYVDLETLNGRLRVYDASRGARLMTTNGSVYAHMRGGMLQAGTTNGAIVAHLLDPNVGGCTLKNTNGGITVTVDESVGADLEAQTTDGRIDCDVPLQNEQEDPGLPRRTCGRIGGGGRELVVHSINGNIHIAKAIKSQNGAAGESR